MSEGFQWVSPLGASVALFLVQGVLWLLIGVATPFLLDAGAGGPAILIVSERTDTAVFGSPPRDLLANDRRIATLRGILLRIVGGLLFAASALVIAVAWFGLRGGQSWALITLVLVGAAVLPFWWVALRPYAGVPITLADLPPFMWVPAALLVPASVLGWLGLG